LPRPTPPPDPTPQPAFITLPKRATSIGLDARVTPLDLPGDAEVGATEHRVPAIAFPKSDRLDARGADDAYGDVRA
jgi:hypothetical protein